MAAQVNKTNRSGAAPASTGTRRRFPPHTPLSPQVLAAALFLAGVILAWVKFPDGNMPDATSSDANSAHGTLGIVLTAMMGAQVVMGFIRPDPNTKLRPYW